MDKTRVESNIKYRMQNHQLKRYRQRHRIDMNAIIEKRKRKRGNINFYASGIASAKASSITSGIDTGIALHSFLYPAPSITPSISTSIKTAICIIYLDGLITRDYNFSDITILHQMKHGSIHPPVVVANADITVSNVVHKTTREFRTTMCPTNPTLIATIFNIPVTSIRLLRSRYKGLQVDCRNKMNQATLYKSFNILLRTEK